jgi:hypothetical protein
VTGLIRKKPMLSRNNARLKKRRAAQFGKQAEACRALPCCICDRRAPSDPHHVRSRGAGGGDEWCLPFCRTHHIQIHAYGRKSFEARNDVDLITMATELAATLKEDPNG